MLVLKILLKEEETKKLNKLVQIHMTSIGPRFKRRSDSFQLFPKLKYAAHTFLTVT